MDGRSRKQWKDLIQYNKMKTKAKKSKQPKPAMVQRIHTATPSSTPSSSFPPIPPSESGSAFVPFMRPTATRQPPEEQQKREQEKQAERYQFGSNQEVEEAHNRMTEGTYYFLHLKRYDTFHIIGEIVLFTFLLPNQY